MIIRDYTDRYADGSLSAEQAIKDVYDRIEATKDTNVFIALSKDRAIKRAKEIDRNRKNGKDVDLLAGVPFAAKDNFLTIDAPTSAASYFLENFISPIAATAIEKLEAQGAICVGKVNLDAFAHGGSTENSYFGVTKNAISRDRVAGGSSGGSAVAVALDVVPFALGTDTGGSIRQPASFNGVVGYKPTYGAVSRYGVVAMASGTDTIGVLSQNANDAMLVASVIAGRDNRDMTTLDDFITIDATQPESTKKIGLIKEFMTEGVDNDVRQSVLRATHHLRELGYEVEEVSLPMLRYALAIYYIVVPAEISSNLARYDGVRYGNRNKDAQSLEDVYQLSRRDGFMTENKRRIILGSYVLSSGYFDAYYQKAQKARTLLIKEFEAVLNNFDFLVGPVAPTPAFKIGDNSDDPLKMYLEDVMTVPASLAGLPAVSVPVDPTESGLPVGLQVIGKRRDDVQVLRLAASLEARYDRG